MRRLPATSRADLLREWSEGRLNEATAALYGYEPKPEGKAPDEQGASATGTGSPGPATEPPPTFEFPSERPRLTFLRAEKTEYLAPLPPPPPGDPINEEELKVPWGRPGLAFHPLIRWARLAGWLQRRLGATVPGHAPDLPRLVRLIGRGQPILTVPRRPRRIWSAQALILLDQTREMDPFQPDLDWLKVRLRREHGRYGLHILPLKRRLPRPRDLARLAPGAPVLALSALGQFTREPATVSAWVELARSLRWRGHPFQALTPCPRRLWAKAVADVWPMAEWDRSARLPPPGRRPPAPRDELPSLVSRLLDHLSPAARIGPKLLRAARLSLGCRTDGGLEWQAWNHPEMWPSPEACCFNISPETSGAYAARLARRAALTGTDVAATSRIAGLIAADHTATCSAAITFEAELRAALSAPSDQPVATARFLERVNDRLRAMIATGLSASSATRTGSLAHWIPGLIQRLTPAMLAHESVRTAVAEALALSHHLSPPGSHTVLPPGLAAADYLRQEQTLPPPTAAPVTLRLSLAATGLESGVVHGRPLAGEEPPSGPPLAFFDAVSGPLHLKLPDGTRHRFEWEPGSPFPGPSLSVPGAIIVQSAAQRLHLDATRRPAWAKRMWYDRYGLAAEFRIRAVPFVLRWIPPGRFLMGSPDDEPGRYDWEGPRHEVRITRGFWMGETPVTQAQWRAVIEAAGEQPGLLNRLRGRQTLNPGPSYFKGPAELPVEQVSWEDSTLFCRLVDALMPEGPGFRLPTEAQWEFACRAGTDTALYTGAIEIRGESNAPALDPVAWYGGNSGNELEVTNPWDAKGWPDRQYPHNQAGTHRVKLKQPNAAGLYDMLGNVWEWCRDTWDEQEFAKRPEGATDPLVDEGGGAYRVVRGGAWLSQARDCRAAIRSRHHPGLRIGFLGLRLSAGQELQAAEPQGAERPLPERRSRARRAGGSEPA